MLLTNAGHLTYLSNQQTNSFASHTLHCCLKGVHNRQSRDGINNTSVADRTNPC